jgi:hypothetical protein
MSRRDAILTTKNKLRKIMAIKTTKKQGKGHKKEREREGKGGGVTGKIQKEGTEPACYVFTENKLVLGFKHSL